MAVVRFFTNLHYTHSYVTTNHLKVTGCTNTIDFFFLSQISLFVD